MKGEGIDFGIRTHSNSCLGVASVEVFILRHDPIQKYIA